MRSKQKVFFGFMFPEMLFKGKFLPTCGLFVFFSSILLLGDTDVVAGLCATYYVKKAKNNIMSLILSQYKTILF